MAGKKNELMVTLVEISWIVCDLRVDVQTDDEARKMSLSVKCVTRKKKVFHPGLTLNIGHANNDDYCLSTQLKSPSRVH